jgi:ElaB/YqjD/DUF883 family membrane-anchored ribosome-binding protein
MATDPVQEMNTATDYAADRGHSEIEELRRQVKDLTSKYGTMAQNRFADVKETVRQNMGDIEQQIRDKPVQATLIAAGIGFLIGALLTR